VTLPRAFGVHDGGCLPHPCICDGASGERNHHRSLSRRPRRFLVDPPRSISSATTSSNCQLRYGCGGPIGFS
jgi:hypothetical protein